MKKSIRILSLLLACMMVLLSLVACDSKTENPDESSASEGGAKTPMVATDIPDDDFEDVKIAKHPSPDKNYYVLYRQLTAPDGGLVGVSLTLYAQDDTELDSVEFFFDNGGKECGAKDVARVTWNSNKTADVKMADSASTVFTLTDKRS